MTWSAQVISVKEARRVTLGACFDGQVNKYESGTLKAQFQMHCGISLEKLS